MTACPFPTLAFALLTGLAASAAHADDFARLQVDLDGDGKPETVVLTVSPGKDEARSMLTVAIGEERFQTDFFSAQGETPGLRVLAIDSGKRWHQVLVTLPEPASCRYEVIGFHAGHLARMLTFDGGVQCAEPQVSSPGTLVTQTWVGFWSRPQSWRLGADGASLQKIVATDFDLAIPGAAGTGLVLDGAKCKAQAIAPGTYLRVTRFDAKLNRYLLETPGGACGWVPAADIDSSTGKVAELPFAG